MRIALRALDQRDVDGYLRVASPEVEVINPASEMEGATMGGRMSGAERPVDLAGVYSFEDNKVRRAHIYLDREAALEAAGLRE